MNDMSIIVLQSRAATEASEKRRLQVRLDKEGHGFIKMNELKLGFPGAIGLEYQGSDGLWCPLGPDNVGGQEQILVPNNQAECVVILEASQKQAATNASVTWKPVTPIENWPPTRLGVFEEGKIYQIPHLNVAHLAECTEKPLLFRHETLRLFRSLTTCYNQPLKSKGMVVNGPPGIGKSCTTWAWVLSQLIQHDQSKQTNQNRQSTRNTNKRLKSNDEQQTVNQSSQTRINIKSALWIHLVKDTAYFVRLTPLEVTEAMLVLRSMVELEEAYQLIRFATEDVVVLDGLLGCREPHVAMSEYLEVRPSGFNVQVASLAFTRSSSELDAMEDRGIQIHEMYPWSLEEYETACRDQRFLAFVKPLLVDDQDSLRYSPAQLIKNKFFFAGSCARWMLATPYSRVQDKIDEKIRRIANIQAHEQLLGGDKSSEISNGLVVKYQPKSSLFYVSQYIAVSLAEKCSSSVLNTLYSTASRLDNNAFRGWVFEMNVVHSCLNKHPLNLYKDNELHSFMCSSLVTVTNKKGKFSFDPSISKPDELIGKLMKPASWNNDAFDMSCLELCGKELFHLHCFQITINKKHSFDLTKYFNYAAKISEFFDNCQIERMSIWMVVPTKSTNDNVPIVEEIDDGQVTWSPQMKVLYVDRKDYKWSTKNSPGNIIISGFRAHEAFYR